MATLREKKPYAPWRIHNKADIYTGPTGTGKIVPNEGEFVVEANGSLVRFHRVLSVNPGNDLSTLTELVNAGVGITPDGLFSIDPILETARFLYVDNTVTPANIAVDDRLVKVQPLSTGCIIFSGEDITDTGVKVSERRDASGLFISNVLPLTDTTGGQYGFGVKYVEPGTTSETLLDGQVVTLVFYNDSGVVTSVERLKVQLTSFVAGVDNASREVVSVSLESPMLSPNSPATILYPCNLDMNTGLFGVVVRYRSGKQVRYSATDPKVAIDGLASFVPNIPGAEYQVIVSYSLQPGESCYTTNSALSKRCSSTYTLTTSPANLSYQVRLHPLLKWKNQVEGYSLTWVLCDAAGSVYMDVTDKVSYKQGTLSFAPRKYGTIQSLSLELSLQLVNPTYAAYLHTQIVQVTLNAPGDYRQGGGDPAPWSISNILGGVTGAAHPCYYRDNVATGVGSLVNLAQTLPNLSSWLLAYSAPINSAFTEAHDGVTVTGYYLTIGEDTLFFGNLSNWNAEVNWTPSISNGDSIVLRFVCDYGGKRFDLGAISAPLYHTDQTGTIFI